MKAFVFPFWEMVAISARWISEVVDPCFPVFRIVLPGSLTGTAGRKASGCIGQHNRYNADIRDTTDAPVRFLPTVLVADREPRTCGQCDKIFKNKSYIGQ
jgi:hypothetical protein